MRAGSLLVLAATVLLAVTGTAIAADNTAPLANAGVDQTVPVNSTVYLDANGSTDPDGEITHVEWTIETPDGTRVTPDCEHCRRTEFDATAVGQYTVTLTVTDDDGATNSDTLYVTTTTDDGPDVSVVGPTSTPPGSNATYIANVSAENATLGTLTWLVNGTVAERDSLDGGSADVLFTHSFDSAGEASVRAVVYDTLGERGSATQRITVSASGGGGGGGGSSSDCPRQTCGADKRFSYGDESYITDGDNDGQVKTYIDGDLTAIDTDAPSVEENPGGTYTIVGGAESVDSSETTEMTINDEGVAVEAPENNRGNTDSGNSDSVDSVQDAADAAEEATGGFVSDNDDGSVSVGGITIGGGGGGGSDGGGGGSDDGGGGFSGGGLGGIL